MKIILSKLVTHDKCLKSCLLNDIFVLDDPGNLSSDIELIEEYKNEVTKFFQVLLTPTGLIIT